MRSSRHHPIPITLLILVIGGIGVFVLYQRVVVGPREVEVPAKPAAPADLERLRDVFTSGLDALQRGDGDEAVRLLTSFSFGSRAVEEYRLYYLANGQQLDGNASAARQTLAKLWRRTPKLVYMADVAFHLAGLYANAGDWRQSAEVYAGLAERRESPTVAGEARWNAALARLDMGDVAGALFDARSVVIRSPRSAEAEGAAALVRALHGLGENAALPLTPSERLDRGTALVAAGDAESALGELNALASDAPQLHERIDLERGIALSTLHRYEESNKLLEPLTSGPFRYAIPALHQAEINYAALADSVEPYVYKTVKVRVRVGTVRVWVGKGKKRRLVRRPRYRTVFRKVKRHDRAKQKKKDEYDRLTGERLKDLLSLHLDEDLRLETLGKVIERAVAKDETEYVKDLVQELVKIERDADPALQYLWDKAWDRYTKGDLSAARALLRFIGETYRQPNVRRQSRYWYARAAERQGEKEEAAAIYRELAAVSYSDLYALYARSRGAPRSEPGTNPLEKNGPDWGATADATMPQELRLAYELTALTAMRDAQLEIRRNMSRQNAHYAEALLADVYHSMGNDVLMYRSLRKAWPQLATVEQDSVPTYFLRMYYPLRYGTEIREHARENGVEPNLVRALILQESYYDPEAKSAVGATGLMQLMPATAKEHARDLHIVFAASRLENPDVNIQLGTFHIHRLIRIFDGNVYLAIAAYNAGEGNVAKWRRALRGKPMDEILESIPFPETRNYVKRVIMLRSAYERIAG